MAQMGINFPPFELGPAETWLDDIRLTDEQPEPPKDLLTDTGGQMPAFLSFLGATATVDRLEDGLEGAPCWRLRYTLEPRTVAGIWATAPASCLAEAAGLRLRVKTTVAVGLTFLVFDAKGGMYLAIEEVEPGAQQVVELAWVRFQRQPAGAGNAQPDPKEITAIGVFDGANFAGGNKHDNELLLGGLEPLQ
jgi:hypothetical protein